MASIVLQTIYKAVDRFSAPVRHMEKANKSLANSNNIVKNSLMTLGAGLSIGSAVFTGFNAIKEYDAALASLKAITGLTGKAFEPFKTQIKLIGTETKKSYIDIAKAMELIGSAQPELLNNAAAMGQVTRASILLAKASGGDLPTSAKTLTNIMNQFGAKASEAAKYVDILSTSEQKGTGTMQYLSDALVNAGSVASTLKMDLDQTSAILQAFAKAGVPAERAGTAFASVMGKLAVQSKKEFNPAIVGSAKAFDNLKKSGLTLKQAQQLVGEEASRYLLTLINQNEVIQTLSGNQYIQGNAALQAAERNKSFNVIMDNMISKFKNLAINGSESSGALNRFGSIITWITDNMGTLIALIGTALILFTAYKLLMIACAGALFIYNTALDLYILFSGKSILLMKKNGIALKALVFWQKAVTVVQWLWNTSLWGCPVIWIIAGILAIVAAIILLIVYWKEVKAWVDKFTNSAIGQILSIIFPILKIIEAISFMMDRWKAIKKAFTDGGFIAGIKAIGKAVLSFMLKPFELIISAIERITGMDLGSKGITLARNMLDEGMLETPKTETVQTVNPVSTFYNQKSETTNKNSYDFTFSNKTDKNVSLRKNNVMIPLISSSYGG